MRVRACVFVTTKNGTRIASICRVKTNSKFEPPPLNNLVIENGLTNAICRASQVDIVAQTTVSVVLIYQAVSAK